MRACSVYMLYLCALSISIRIYGLRGVAPSTCSIDIHPDISLEYAPTFPLTSFWHRARSALAAPGVQERASMHDEAALTEPSELVRPKTSSGNRGSSLPQLSPRLALSSSPESSPSPSRLSPINSSSAASLRPIEGGEIIGQRDGLQTETSQYFHMASPQRSHPAHPAGEAFASVALRW
jgi:hypothetical protein